MPTIVQLKEIIKQYNKKNCPKTSGLKKAQLLKIVESFGEPNKIKPLTIKKLKPVTIKKLKPLIKISHKFQSSNKKGWELIGPWERRELVLTPESIKIVERYVKDQSDSKKGSLCFKEGYNKIHKYLKDIFDRLGSKETFNGSVADIQTILYKRPYNAEDEDEDYYIKPNINPRDCFLKQKYHETLGQYKWRLHEAKRNARNSDDRRIIISEIIRIKAKQKKQKNK